MPRHYTTAAAFRQALEERIRQEADRRVIPINDLRQKLVMERLLCRLFRESDSPWLLKGGFAMDLRYRPHARVTRDLDLTVESVGGDTLNARTRHLRETLQQSAETDCGDFLRFEIGSPRGELPGPPAGGARFPVIATLAGTRYAGFHIDAGFGDAMTGSPERLSGEPFFDFAGLETPVILAIPVAQQFAEKIHAYTYRWTDRQNTRVKDLVDLCMLIERNTLDRASVANAIAATFSTRSTHPVPYQLAAPPAAWSIEYEQLARKANVQALTTESAFAELAAFWSTLESSRHTSD